MNPVLFGNELSLEADRADHSKPMKEREAPGPCASSRAIAMAHIAIADVCSVFGANFAPFYATLEQHNPQQASKSAAIATAALTVVSGIYKSQTTERRSTYDEFIKRLEMREPNVDEGIEIGKRIGKLVLDKRKRDNPLALVTAPYKPKGKSPFHDVDPLHEDQGFYGAKWGALPRFVLTPDDVFENAIVPAPPQVTEEEYKRDFDEVKKIGRFKPSPRTETQTQTGIFWAYDGANLIGTPPRLYNQFVVAVTTSKGLSVDETARVLALCNLALVDAGVVCWAGKYKWELWRPVLGIRHEVEPEWEPLGAPASNPISPGATFEGLGFGPSPGTRRADFTPNFPSYPSGHATFGSACFNALKLILGDSINITFLSDELNGFTRNSDGTLRERVIRAYSSINEALEENEISRIYLGVHWRFDQTRGTTSGLKVADYVTRHAYRLKPEAMGSPASTAPVSRKRLAKHVKKV